MTDELPASMIFCGRTLSAQEPDLMRQTASELISLGVTEIVRTSCELLERKRPNGRFVNH